MARTRRGGRSVTSWAALCAVVACWMRVLPIRGEDAALAANGSLTEEHGVGTQQQALYVPLNRTCHPDCPTRGNCNIEFGVCECPWGYGGPACADPLLPGCQLRPGGEPFWGFMVPRSCACAAQARRFFGCSDTHRTCTLCSFYFRDSICFRFTDRPESEQYSVPPPPGQAGVEWWRGNVGLASPPGSMRSLAPEQQGLAHGGWGRDMVVSPLDECPSRCSEFGACLRSKEAPPAQPQQTPALLLLRTGTPRQDARSRPHCLCYKGRTGHDCSITQNHLCPNECLGRGVCHRGFCHCRPPYFGLDCSRQYAWQLAPGAVHVPNRRRLRIYMYDLPTHIAFPVAIDDDVTEAVFTFYHTYRSFMDLLTRDEAVRTENPWEANLFYVPAQAFSYTSNTNNPANQLTRVLSYVRDTYPWFNMSGGRDHFVWTTGDRGSCYVPRELRHVIQVTQFGLHVSLRDNRTTFLHPLPEHPDHGCYHPAKDVLAAPWFDDHQGVGDASDVYRELVNVGGADPKRDVLVFFAGTVRPRDTVYSGGARQRLALYFQSLKLNTNGTAPNGGAGGGAGDASPIAALISPGADPAAAAAAAAAIAAAAAHNNSDVLFIEGHTHNYGELHKRSRFCLAPHGAGFGIRLTIAMAHACIPVIVQDGVWQPYESDGLLPYSEFSLRLGLDDVPYLLPVLRSVPEERLRAMRLAMAKHYGAFVWSPQLGGTAYNHTIEALRKRLPGVWGRLWQARRRRRRQ